MGKAFERLRCEIEHLKATEKKAQDLAGENEELRLLLETYLEQVCDAIADTKTRWHSLLAEHTDRPSQ